MTSRIRPSVVFKCPHKDGLVSAMFEAAGAPSVFVPGTSDLPAGAHVELSVVFEEEPRTFRTRGVVRWKRESLGHPLPPGIAIELAKGEEATRDLMIAYARGYELEWTARRDRRLPIAHPVSFAAGDYLTNGATLDISKTGCFVTSDQMLEVGAEIEIKIKPDGELFALRFAGTVIWQGPDRGGMGVRFIFPNAHTRQRFEAFIDRLSEQADQVLETHGPSGRL